MYKPQPKDSSRLVTEAERYEREMSAYPDHIHTWQGWGTLWLKCWFCPKVITRAYPGTECAK